MKDQSEKRTVIITSLFPDEAAEQARPSEHTAQTERAAPIKSAEQIHGAKQPGAARQASNAKPQAAIVAENVAKYFGKVTALAGVSLIVPKGKVIGLLGPNGAGKTTLVRILTTLLPPDGGTVTVSGFDVVKQAQQVRKVIGLAGQSAAVDENLTGRENLEMVAQLYHVPRAEAKTRAKKLLEDFQLTDAADRSLKTYSGGMRRRLDLAASLVGNPNILFLDEPTTGLDPHSRIGMWEVIKTLATQGTTVLLTTQYLEEADYLADHIAVINRGKLIAQGTPEQLKSQIGGDVLELHLTDKSRVREAAELIQPLGAGRPHIDDISHQITLPISDGAKVLVEAIRQLDTHHIGIADIILRRPTLDEVFLKLTGRQAEIFLENQ